MDLLTVVIIGVIVAATGVINPKPKDSETVAKAPETQVITPVVEAKPEPEPVKEPEPEPEPVKEPEPTPEPVKESEPEPEPETKQEEPKEEVSAEPTQEQDAKPEEEEVTPVTEETTEAADEEKGISMLNIILYILGAIAVIAAGIYFFMRREPSTQSAADIARAQSQQDPSLL
tara:strand:+ start:17 stop:538 length:522 start_codon:yes stop_codon:yes gene_type:complete